MQLKVPEDFVKSGWCPIFSQAKSSSILPNVSFTLSVLSGAVHTTSGRESWGLWGAHTTWLVGDGSVHATRLTISRLCQLPDSVLCLLVSKAHTRSDARNVRTQCPGRCFSLHTWTRSRKMLLCSEKTNRKLHPPSSATPLGCFHVPRQPPCLLSLAVALFTFSRPDWIFSILISICCWPPNWHLFTVNDPGSPSGQQTLADLGVEN